MLSLGGDALVVRISKVPTNVFSLWPGWIQTPPVIVRRRLAAICLGVAATVFVCGVMPAFAVTGGAWLEPAAASRLVFNKPRQESFCLLSVPARLDDVWVSAGKAWSEGDARPVRLVWTNAATATFLVDCREGGEQQEVALYLLTNAVPPRPDESVSDPRPVRFYAQRTGGQDLPETWEQLQMLDVRVDGEPTMRSIDAFDLESERSSGWNHGDWQRKNHLIQLAGWVLMPKAGRYVFRIRSDSPMWLLVDDVLAAKHGESRRTDWSAGQPMALSAGLHHVVLRGATRHGLQLAAGWKLEGAHDADDVKLVTGGEAVRGRLEWRDRDLQVLAVATAGKPYAFEGVTNVFVPVQFESRSVSRAGRTMLCTWRCNGRELGTGRVLRTTLPAARTPAQITLTVAETGGATAQDCVTLSTDVQPRYGYCVSGRLVGVPAVGYSEDPVRPEIHVRATSPDDIDFQVDATLDLANGLSTNVAGRVDMVRSWGRLVLPTGTADGLRRIAWRVSQDGVILDSGVTIFDRAPFHGLPDALDGDALLERGEAVMLVARHASAGEPAGFEGLRCGQRVVLLDGFLVSDSRCSNTAARLEARLGRVDETDPDSAVNLKRCDLRALEATSSVNGVSRLWPLVQAGGFLPAQVVVLAPACDGLGQGETLEAFERRLSALAGLLAGPGHATVVLVTPPPFTVLPGCDTAALPGLCPPDARQLAELICRVADANGLPVVDLYTGFMTAADGRAWVQRDALTAEGCEQAAEMLRRVLFGPRKADL